MPEEINRRLTDHVSEILFTPSENAVTNLLKEGIDRNKIFNVGDVMQDCVRVFGSMIRIGEQKEKYILSTIHRQENTDDPKLLKDIFTTLSRLSSHVAKVILPLHPRTRKMVAQLAIEVKGIELIDPIGYLEMLALLKHCELVVTDSGGLQKEAYYLGKKCITLRPETEWVELVEYGYNYIPKNYLYDEVIMGINELKATEITNFSIYGDGFASEKIIQVIEQA